MALNRAQLLAGNSLDGPVLTGQPQGVVAGAGISISATGVITLDTATLTSVVKTNNTFAYNSYVWPGSAGAAGSILTSDGLGGLSWVPAGATTIAFTALGQLLVGTGPSTSTFLNAGSNTAALVADSTSASGLNYTSTIKTALLLPVGNATTDRPAAPTVGQVRYNNVSNAFEGYSGSPAAWKPLGGVPTGGGNDKIFYNNGQVVTTNYTIPTGENSMSAGSVTINTGITVTVPVGSNWSIV